MSLAVHGQTPAFYHLGTAEGLSDNSVNSVVRDRNGILWIGTTEGLNSFDGNRVSTYYKYQYPELGGNDILQVACDLSNRIWLRTPSNTVTMLDERRKFHSFSIGDSSHKGLPSYLITTRSRGLLVLKGGSHFITDDKDKNHFRHFSFPGDSIIPGSPRIVSRFDDDMMIYYGDNRLVVVDYSSLSILLDMPFTRINGVTGVNKKELLAYTVSGSSFYRISIPEKRVVATYTNLLDQDGKQAGDLRNICRINENQFAITSRFSGVYFLDLPTQSLQRWSHDPLDQRSIGGDNTANIYYDSSGYLFVTTRSSGLHYFNRKQPMAVYRSYFKDENAQVFDGFIQAIVEDKQEVTWLGTQDRLIKWDRKTGKTSFIDYYLPGGSNLNKDETIRALLTDEKENLWVGTSRHGILVLDKNQKTVAHIHDSMPASKGALPVNWINVFCRASNGDTWVGTLRGVCRIARRSWQVENFSKHPVLSGIGGVYCNSLWFDKNDRLWIGTNNGAWCYAEKEQSLRHFTTANGLSHNRVLSFNEDDAGNIYIGTVAGLTVLGKNGNTTIYNRSNGLRNDKCEGILKDEKGFLWIGNLNCVLRFDPVANKYAVYEEGYGFSHAGFRMRSCYKNESGEMFWGSDKGLTYFFPSQMSDISAPLVPSINALQLSDTVIRFTAYGALKFPYTTSSFMFLFSSGELTGGKSIQYQYHLLGYEKDWKHSVDNGQVVYSRLSPGHYSFEVKASRDGITWYEAHYPVSFVISKPWWGQTWFRLICLAVAAGVVYGLYYYLQRRKQSREIQKMISYFANSGYEHSSVDDILWDICRNCVSGLGFDDCVIYLLDEERNVLVQKAAYGPKNPKAFEIANPIEIPPGKGIVGDVALSGKAGVVNDTSKDKRYIVDDEIRLSEITVPLIHEGKVIGIIDSENRQKNFFRHRHLQALQTIATLCSAKISRAMAIDAMRKSKMELMELNVKMAESKFLNLRLQMNPHFLFNSLSSIQHLIVSQQTTKAYRYLTVFSHFLRSLLKYAEKNFIPLDEELAILRMYVELESLRFDQSFSYAITVDESLANDEVLVPSLMVQPFAENAIWHGLLHKEGEKKLAISFSNNSDECLTCVIEDNGVGREKASAVRQNKISSMVHESRGIRIIEERLDLLQQKTGKPAVVQIDDLYDKDRNAIGTKVIITIPYYNPEES